MAGTLHFSSVFSIESNGTGRCLTVTTAVLKSSRLNVSFFSVLFLIVSTYSDWLLKHVPVWAVMHLLYLGLNFCL